MEIRVTWSGLEWVGGGLCAFMDRPCMTECTAWRWDGEPPVEGEEAVAFGRCLRLDAVEVVVAPMLKVGEDGRVRVLHPAPGVVTKAHHAG